VSGLGRLSALLAVLLPCALSVHAQTSPAAGRSGFDLMSRELQAMQRDDSLNPGMLWVQEGLERWSRRDGTAQRACADCHGNTPETAMADAATRYPAWDTALGRPVTLAERIAECRSRHQRASLTPADAAPALLALETALAHASRGRPVAPPPDPRLAPWRERGQALWKQRMGQLNLSCAQCHDDRAGGRLGGAVIPPGNANGYPTYRLEWQAVGTLQRRLRNCMTGVRAEPFAAGADEWGALEVFLAWRDRGLAVETPAVRP